MGSSLGIVPVRQRPDLNETKPRPLSGEETGPIDPAIRFVILALLAVDGVLSALAGALFMPFFIGVVPFPVSALISGVVNAALVWAAGRWTRSTRVAALPLWAWLITVAAMSVGFPHGDVVLGGTGILAYGALILIVLGGAPPAWVLWRREAAVADIG